MVSQATEETLECAHFRTEMGWDVTIDERTTGLHRVGVALGVKRYGIESI